MHRFALLLIASSALAATAYGQRSVAFDSAEETRAALADALAERSAAEARSEQFEAQALQANTEAERAAREAAALAARIQQAEAGIAAANVRIGMIDAERETLREEIGRQQRPAVELTAALQKFSRRPVALAVLRPGTVKDLVYLRAMLHETVPRVRARTQGLRGRIARGRELRSEQLAASEVLRAEEQALAQRRTELAELESSQRLAARAAGSEAGREADRALALAEQARDLDDLVGELDRAAALRQQLAAFPGPQMRPAQPGTASAEPAAPTPSATGTSIAGGAPVPYVLPVAGRTVTGFRAPRGGTLSTGITIAPIAGAQVTAPAAGRIAFAGPYRGYGQIVIVEHGDGWTSLVTGLARADAVVGTMIEVGAPLGVAGPDRPSVTLELRHDGEPVNPLRYTK